MTRKLIRRNTPLGAGTTLTLAVTTYYDVQISDWLEGELSITLDDLSQWIAGTSHVSDEAVANAARRHLDALFAEVVWSVGDVRFEQAWEAEMRERGRSSFLAPAEYVELPS